MVPDMVPFFSVCAVAGLTMSAPATESTRSVFKARMTFLL